MARRMHNQRWQQVFTRTVHYSFKTNNSARSIKPVIAIFTVHIFVLINMYFMTTI